MFQEETFREIYSKLCRRSDVYIVQAVFCVALLLGWKMTLKCYSTAEEVSLCSYWCFQVINREMYSGNKRACVGMFVFFYHYSIILSSNTATQTQSVYILLLISLCHAVTSFIFLILFSDDVEQKRHPNMIKQPPKHIKDSHDSIFSGLFALTWCGSMNIFFWLSSIQRLLSYKLKGPPSHPIF